MAVHAEAGGSAAQMPVDSVSIADRNRGRLHAFPGHPAPAAVAHGVTRTELLDLKHLDLQRSHGVETDSGQGADAVDAYSETYHVELVLGEAFDSGGIQDMPERPVADGRTQFFRTLAEKPDLREGEFILGRIFGGRKVGVYRLHPDFVMGFQEGLQGGQLVGHEAETVHAGIELDVHRPGFQAALPQGSAQGLERVEIRDARFEPVVDYLGEEVGSGGEHQYRQRDSVASELHPFDRQGHCKVVGSFRLEHGGEFHGSVAVGVGLHEHEQPGGRLQQGAEISIVVPAGRDAEFQPGEIVFVVHLVSQTES